MHIVYLNFGSKASLIEIINFRSKVLTFATSVSPQPFPYVAIGPLVIGLRHLLGQCLTVRPPLNGYPRRIIVKFGCAFEMCD